jgi:hypothetical protein
MAYEGFQIKVPGLTASADLSAKQYYFVKISGNRTVDVCSAVTDIPVGVLQNAPTSGQAAEVCGIGVTKVSGDADLTAGNVIGTSSDGQAAAYAAGTDTTKYACGLVVDDNTAAGGLLTAAINCWSPGRAA